ncbi:hypothetical protein [Pectobacterium odoriferum]|uniref:hypothetical protein n=1 Tax=Pectobacterium odoriferum TaxID=78398 RepID=UPI000CD096C5|nr:hypothetical protein [Pectobacterium odoriferum]POD96420.1 hypothetical protein BVY06_08750 [Pectobacterium odoriferum]
MYIIATHHFYSNDFYVEEQDKEIWINGKLTHTVHSGLECEYDNGVSEDSPFHGQAKLQTLYFTDKGTVQHSHEDDSFYFIHDDETMATYVDGKLMTEDPNGEYNEFIDFVNDVMKDK